MMYNSCGKYNKTLFNKWLFPGYEIHDLISYRKYVVVSTMAKISIID